MARKAKRMMRFGGPSLPEGSRTWYYDLTQPLDVLQGAPPDWAMVHVYPGTEVPADHVKDAASYVERGMAEWVDAPTDTTG